MHLNFIKMHGLGNDFIVFDAASDAAVPDNRTMAQLGDRRTGIGFDQALVLLPPRGDGADVYYRVFNTDGSEVEQCGNGARCIARLIATRVGRRQVHMDSLAGRVDAEIDDDGQVSVDMGVPNFDPASLPFEATRQADVYPLRIGERELAIGAVSMGNPHAVIEVPSVRGSRRGHPRPRGGESPTLCAAYQRRLPADPQAKSRETASPRARRRRDTCVRNWRVCGRSGWSAARTTR